MAHQDSGAAGTNVGKNKYRDDRLRILQRLGAPPRLEARFTRATRKCPSAIARWEEGNVRILITDQQLEASKQRLGGRTAAKRAVLRAWVSAMLVEAAPKLEGLEIEDGIGWWMGARPAAAFYWWLYRSDDSPTGAEKKGPSMNGYTMWQFSLGEQAGADPTWFTLEIRDAQRAAIDAWLLRGGEFPLRARLPAKAVASVSEASLEPEVRPDQVVEALEPEIPSDPTAERHVELLLMTRNVVLEGVPGTGKTHAVHQIRRVWRGPDGAPRRLGRASVRRGAPDEGHDAITLHPATTYEDFVEGVRPRAARRDAAEAHADDYRNELADGALCVRTSVGGAPRSVQEHAGATWFFQPLDAASGTNGWGVEDGFFLRICAKAVRNPGRDFLVLLDEFNRANVPKVMGDLLTTLERSKRARWVESGARGGFWDLTRAATVTLPISKRLFFVPENVFVLGTMNTSDRSVTPLDAALRRRLVFSRLEPMHWLELAAALRLDVDESLADARAHEPRAGVDERLAMVKDDLWRICLSAYARLNALLLEHLGPDGMIGHSYFFDLQTDIERSLTDDRAAIFDATWRYAVLPQIIATVRAAGREDAFFTASRRGTELQDSFGEVLRSIGYRVELRGDGYLRGEVVSGRFAEVATPAARGVSSARANGTSAVGEPA